jgi:hypothetical protein
VSLTASPLHNRMIFLLGARRSGTNWLHRVLGAHPDVALIPSETYLFSRGIAPLRERFHHGVRGSPGTGFIFMEEEDLVEALRDFCDRAMLPFLKAFPGARRLAERTPEHVTCLELIGQIYPDAHIVHIVRDGRDVARSLLSQGWKSAPTSLEEAAAEWRHAIDAAEAAAPKLKHYRMARYEDLLTNTLTEVSKLYSWLGLSSTPEDVRAALVEAEIPFNVDAAAPELASGKWRHSFTASDHDVFLRVAGEALLRLGYVGSDGDTPPPKPKLSEAPTRVRFFADLSRRLSGAAYERAFSRRLVEGITDAQRIVDRMVAGIATGRLRELESMTEPSVWVRFVGLHTEWQGRGPSAWAQLIEALSADEALTGRQLRGDLNPSLPTSSAVLRLQTPDGLAHDRVIIVTVQGDRVSRLVYHQFPPGPVAPA